MWNPIAELLRLRKLSKQHIRGEQNQKENQLPPPVRKLVLGQESEEEDLKMVIADFYDMIERLENQHGESYAEVNLQLEGKNIEVELVKDRGATADRSTRTTKRKFKEEKMSFTLRELLDKDRNYHTEQAETQPMQPETREEPKVEVETRDKGSPSMDEIVEEDTANGLDIDSPLDSGSSKNQSLKDTIQNHNSKD